MDEITDPAKKDQISRFLDNRTLRVQPFGPNVSADRAYRRAERIVAAIHLVTNHISGDEPARGLSRRSSLDLLSSMLPLRDEMRSPESVPLKRTRALIRKLISLVRILSVAGHLSLQNAETLVEALDELGNFLLVSQRTSLSEGVHLVKDELLDAGYPLPSHDRLPDIASARERRQPVRDRPKRKDSVSDKSERKPVRTERVVGVLTTQGQLGIKDIAANLPEYSEKMIQRELRGLVTLGRVKKAGSKRWSTYSLA